MRVAGAVCTKNQGIISRGPSYLAVDIEQSAEASGRIAFIFYVKLACLVRT